MMQLKPVLSTTLLLICLINIAALHVFAQGRPTELVASTPPLSPDEERKAFHLPPGFDAQLVACEPDLHKPMDLAFDDLGRLWVTSSLEYPFPAKEGSKPRDAVVIFTDLGPDGRARKVATFADGLNIPIGLLPLSPREALVHSIPAILRLTDTDGDGQADRRQVAYAKIGSADTHGMTNHFTWGFDGWIYACHGFANTSTIQGNDGKAITMQSGNTYRLRADGSRIEQYTWGQVNPFGLAIDPLGNLFTCDCHSRPIYQILRGAYYPSFGKPDDGLGFGPEMMTHDHGSTGIGGIAYYAADQFPKPFHGTIFVGNVVTSRINHDRLERHGSTLVAIPQPDFMTSDDPWFRPVDLTIGPDGALYVADFYNRIIGHYEVPLTHPGRDRQRGRIWRIVYKGNDPHSEPISPRPDWTKASDDELIADLSHSNLAVRMRSMNQLVTRAHPSSLKALLATAQSSPNASSRMHALWVLERRGILDEATLSAAAKAPDPGVRVHAMRILSERPLLPESVRSLLLIGLHDPDAFVRRASADALGRFPSAANIRPLLELRQSVPADDTHLLHVARMALRDQLRPSATWPELHRLNLTERDRRDLADVAIGVHTLDSARFLLDHIRTIPEPGEKLLRYVHHIARFGDEGVMGALVTFAMAHRPNDLAHQAVLIRTLRQGLQEKGATAGPAANDWAEDVVGRLLASSNEPEILQGMELAGQLRITSAEPRLEATAGNRNLSHSHRLAALNAIIAIEPKRPLPLLSRVLSDPVESMSLREQAANLLAKINQPESLKPLVDGLPIAPSRLQTTIALGLSRSKPGALALLDLIETGKASARLLQDRAVQAQLRQAGVPNLDDRLTTLLKDAPPPEQKYQELLQRRSAGFATAKGDALRGANVFEKHCGVCHQVAGKGARIGPQLDGIGVRGPDRLMEDILDPNRNVDQAFRVTNLALANGQIATGLLLREEGAVLILADAQGKELRVPKDTVEERTTAQMSPMPSNLSDQIAEADFYDLLSFLLAQQPRTEGK
jgi:putative heme-binding domain-containing protein